MDDEISLLDGAATEGAVDASTDAPATDTPAWMLSDGVNGEGDRPEWFNDKYESVSEQAKGYNELSKKFGGFTGAPESYQLNTPEEMGTKPDGTPWLDESDPSVSFIRELGKDYNMNQDMFDALTGGWLRHTSEGMQQSHAAEMELLGPQGQDKLNSLAAWGNTHLSADLQDDYRGLVTSAAGVKVMQAILAKTRNTALVDSSQAQVASGMTKDKLTEMMADERYQTSASYRAEVENKFKKHYPDG